MAAVAGAPPPVESGGDGDGGNGAQVHVEILLVQIVLGLASGHWELLVVLIPHDRFDLLRPLTLPKKARPPFDGVASLVVDRGAGTKRLRCA